MHKLNFLQVVAAALLTGCAVTPNQDEIGPFPSDYKQTIKSHVLRTFFDPYTLRSASVSFPTQGHLLFQQGWIVCLEVNAKNRMGGYIGLQRTAYLLNRDRVIKTVEKAGLCNDPQVSYSPWLELELEQTK